MRRRTRAQRLRRMFTLWAVAGFGALSWWQDTRSVTTVILIVFFWTVWASDDSPTVDL